MPNHFNGQLNFPGGMAIRPVTPQEASTQAFSFLKPMMEQRQQAMRQQFQDFALPALRARLAGSGFLHSDQALAQERLAEQALRQDLDSVSADTMARALQTGMGFSQLGQQTRDSSMSGLLSALGMANQQRQFAQTLPLEVARTTGFFNPPTNVPPDFSNVLQEFLIRLLGVVA